MRVGVLALQGDFAKHSEALRSLGIEVLEVKKGDDLQQCDGLIIPGGESTVMLRQIDFIGMRDSLLEFAKQSPLFGTCAGLILMSQHIQGSALQPLKLIDVEVERNAFGRQVDSFNSFVSLELESNYVKRFPAYFIRAPRIRRYGEGVEVLARWEGEPILVRQGRYLGATFHPELTQDPSVHIYFMQMIRKEMHS